MRIIKTTFQDEELPHDLFLTTRQKAKIRNAFSNNMSTDIKLSKVQSSKIIQSAGFVGKTLGNMMGNIGKKKKALLELAVPLVKDVFA